MPFWLALLLLPVSAAGIILSAVLLKKKPIKILGIILFSIIFALMLLYMVLVLILVFREDDPYDDSDPDSRFVAQIENMTDNGDGTYTYDDGETSLTFEKLSAEAAEDAIGEASSDGSVLNGESGGRNWTVVTDDEGNPQTVYVTAGDTAVAAKVNRTSKEAGAEYTASTAAVLVTDKNKSRTDSASFYIEEADCLLYYPAQLTIFSDKNGKYTFRDDKSDAVLKVTLSKNEYSSMAEVEGFIKNSENSYVLAYGPDWFTSEIREKGKVSFTYSGLGSKYVVDAELTYAEKDKDVFDKLQKLVKCCFVGDGMWKSKASGEGYSKDKATPYSDKFSRELASFYSEKFGVILLYPEIFSEIEKTDEYIFITDPVTGAEITFFGDSDCIPLSDWAEVYGFDESFIDGERRVKASDMAGGRYGVMYLTDKENVCAVLTYPEKYAWVYEEFEEKFTIVASGSEIRNIEMQTVFIEEYGALITMPLQFVETSFYEGVVRYRDELNGMEMTVSFDYLASDKERKNLFACFDVIAADEDIFIGDSYVRWLSNSGFFYGARGSEMKALMQIDAPNVERAYESTLPLFSVEFVTEDSKEETKAQRLAKEIADARNMSDPPEEEETKSAEEITYPNKYLIYNPESDYTYASADGEYWYSFEKEYIETHGFEPEGVYFEEQKELVIHILDILRYNHYDIDKLTREYYKEKGNTIYLEEGMLISLTEDTELAMYFAYKCTPEKDSDLGVGVPSVLEEICNILDIEKPDYVRDKGDAADPEPSTTSEAEATPEPSETSSEAVTISSDPDRYRISGAANHDAEYGYDSKMADTIDKILTRYDENDIAAYIANVYGDETLVGITEEMYMGKYDVDYGYTTTLVYILSNYPNDPVVSTLAKGEALSNQQIYSYFSVYDDYGTGWGEPDTCLEPVWRINDRNELGEFELLTNTELCGDIYDYYGDVLLFLTYSSNHGETVPFWVNGWENEPKKASYCRDFIVPKAINFIDEYCSGTDDFIMDCLSADAQVVSFNADGKKLSGIKFTAHTIVFDGDDTSFDTMEFYLDIKTGALYQITSGKTVKVCGSILG